jgi:L-ascorbate metabolism protein UlaG (beta-lactamase superfamily)
VVLKKRIIVLTLILIPFLSSSILSKDNYMEYKVMKEDKKFVNHEKMRKTSLLEGIKMTWDFVFEKGERTPKVDLPYKKADLDSLLGSSDDNLSSTWLGHSTLFINIDGFKILTDPVFERKVTIVGPKRFNKDLPMDYKKIKSVDLVIVSHNHYDHLNKFSIKYLSKITKKFIVPLGVSKTLEKWGVSKDQIIEMEWWQKEQPLKGLEIVSTPSQHFSGRGLFDSNKTLWSSFVIKTDNHNIFFSGDTGYFEGFKVIGEKYGPFDVTFLECGAYNEKWHFVHMYPEETIKAHIDLKGKYLHPIHWATFNLSMHAWYEPMERAKNGADKENINLITPYPGEYIDYSLNPTTLSWWKPLIKDGKGERLKAGLLKVN